MAEKISPAKLKKYRDKRDFEKTPEPSGEESPPPAGGGLRFVVQKHAASHLHYDLRLEMEGVMRSWAVPKGPSFNPRVRRLAMEVEDHPISYNEFEGTIPAGEYGGGTVMLWDLGTYFPDEPKRGEQAEAAVLRGYREGKLSITFEGERLRGSFALVRTDTVEGGVRSKWLMLKHRDEEADSGEEITEVEMTSVVSGRTMDEIAAGKGGGKVWHSNRKGKKGRAPAARPPAAAEPARSASLLPMLATSASAPPTAGEWTYEPKYDGIRVLAFAGASSAALITRNGNEKTRQFPEIVQALQQLVVATGQPVVLDGEIVPLEGEKLGRFEGLQGRMHVQSGARVGVLAQEAPATLVAFDLLLVGKTVLVQHPWTERREALEELLEGHDSDQLRLGDTTRDHRKLEARAKREGWEGIMAKRVDARYRPGQRSNDWLKLKLENQQELVVGGWTEPRKSRTFMGAILLGYYDTDGKFVYAGHTGTGFSRAGLEELHGRLKKLERSTSPFSEKIKTNEPAHWVSPKVVVEVRFNEWTREGKLRQPVYLGIRDDRDPKTVVREPSAAGSAALAQASGRSAEPASEELEESVESVESAKKKAMRAAKAGKSAKSTKSAKSESGNAKKAKPAKSMTADSSAKSREPTAYDEALDPPVARKIRAMREAGKEGELELGGEASISVSSLGKVFYPGTGHTKGDLLLYYARMADYILPWMKDRPLVLKRFPNGVDGQSFYQQAAPSPNPAGVRVETLRIEGKNQRRLVGGNLATLLYTIQLGAISYDPWHSRIEKLDSADYTVLDLDPGPGVGFQTVVKVARWVKEEMDRLDLHGGLKTSGSSGIHIYLPLPPATPLEAATLVAQIVATRVAKRHPEVATVERMTRNRPKGTVYVDYLQNILGKTVAGVYAVRAKETPTVSTPLAWDELTDSLDIKAFTVDTVPARVASRGDLWAPAMKKANSLQSLVKG